MMIKFINISVVFILTITNLYLFSQDKKQEFAIDCKTDTLLVIAGKTLCEYSTYFSREDFLNAEMIYVNHDDLVVASFNVSSFTLGNSLYISIRSNLITEALKKNLVSGEINYKYINLQDILLKDEQNNYIKPTLQNLKIIFLD